MVAWVLVSLRQIDHNNRMITLSVITLSGFHCIIVLNYFFVFSTNFCFFQLFSSVLWKALYPTQWTRGVWSFDYIPPKDTDIPQVHNLIRLTPSDSVKLNGLIKVVRPSPGLNLIRLTPSYSAKLNGYKGTLFIKPS
jgi:hypothetical protein